MKSAVLYAPRDVRLEEREALDVSGDDVLVKVKACGICPTDLRKYTGASEAALPLVLGHEAAGDVYAIGPEVEEVRVDERVIVMPWWSCGRCSMCRLGKFMRCPNLVTIGGAAEDSIKVNGAFSEYVRVPERAVVKLGSEISYEEATFADPLTSALNSIERCHISIGDNVVIVGAGPLGMLHLQLAKLRGARIIVSDTIEERREEARKLGAHVVIDPQSQDPVAAVREATDGQGADAVVVAVGNAAAEKQGIHMAGNEAVVILFAGTWPATTIEIDPNEIHYTEKVITGAFGGTPEQFMRAVKLLQLKLVDVACLITHRMPLDDLGDGFEMTLDGVGMKKMVLP